VAEEIKVPSLPDVKIIKDGKQVDTSAIDNYDEFMAFLMQASIAANAVKVRKLAEDRASKGEIVPFTLNITQNSQEISCPYPCQSLYIENDGPGEIFVTINSRNRTPTPVAATRKAYFPFENHVIERFFVWSALGTVATSKAILKY
jgi:hypothetical protein